MSTLKADTIQNTSGGAVTLTKQHAAKTWVSFDGSTATIDESFAVSSLTDDATGSFFVNNTSAMSNGDYNVATCQNSRTSGTSSGNTASLYKVFTYNSSLALSDASATYGNSHGDLA